MKYAQAIGTVEVERWAAVALYEPRSRAIHHFHQCITLKGGNFPLGLNSSATHAGAATSRGWPHGSRERRRDDLRSHHLAADDGSVRRLAGDKPCRVELPLGLPALRVSALSGGRTGSVGKQVTFERTGALLAMLMVTLARPAAYSLASGHHREEEGHEQAATCPNGGRQKCLVPN